MGYLTEEVKRRAPWNVLFPDNVVLVNETRDRTVEGQKDGGKHWKVEGKR